MLQGIDRSELVGLAGVVGLLIQIAMGFALAGNHALIGTLLLTHMIVGASGLALVAYLAWRALSWAPGSVKALYAATLALVLVQVALGFSILSVGDYQLVMAHEAGAIAVLLLLAAAEAQASRTRAALAPT